MKEVEYKLEVKTEDSINTLHFWRTTEYDEKKWNAILNICKERKVSITELIETYLETLTPEKAEEILFALDV